MSAATVWVVDDDRSVRFVLATALREAGHAVREFGSAADALAALRDGTPALIFTDVRMPGDDDGLALLRKLRAAHPALPVIVMSAHTDVASTAVAFRGGAWEFLSKPFDLDHAVTVVLQRPAGGVVDVAEQRIHDAAAEQGDGGAVRRSGGQAVRRSCRGPTA